MLPGNGIRNADKTCYTTDDRYQFAYQGHGVPLNTTDIKEYIRNPHKFNINGGMDGRYYNLWSTDNERTDANDDVVIKSVYDPSPVGYSLPASNAFTGFTTTGGNTSTISQFNVKGGFDKGYYFYTKKNKQGNTAFYIISGLRNNLSANILNFDKTGYYYIATPKTKIQGGYFLLNASNVLPLDGSSRSYACPVRSAEEVSTLQLPTIHKKINALKGTNSRNTSL